MPMHFTPAEYAARQAKARSAVQAAGLDALLMFAPESHYWISGYDTFGFAMFQCMVLTARGDPGFAAEAGCPVIRLPELAA